MIELEKKTEEAINKIADILGKSGMDETKVYKVLIKYMWYNIEEKQREKMLVQIANKLSEIAKYFDEEQENDNQTDD